MSGKALRTTQRLLLCLLILFSSCSSSHDAPSALQAIRQRGYLLVGTTGDYRPMTFREADGSYWGFDIEMARHIAAELSIDVRFVPTSWPTLSDDVKREGYMDFAIGGITITDARKQTMLMSDGYLHNGKTILCRASEADRYRSIEDVNQPGVTVMVNPGGQNEVFARKNLTRVKEIKVHPNNEEIPALIAEGAADVMITEILEAPYYTRQDERLAAPLLSHPFTEGEVGILLPPDRHELLDCINAFIEKIKADGSLRTLHEQYGFIYRY